MRWWQLLKISVSLIRMRFIRNEENHQLAKKAIANQLSDLGGIAMKIGQIVADTGQSEELRGLLDKEDARPLSEMMPILEQELEQKTGQSIAALFLNIEESCNAASLGQVHQAKLTNGDKVAIKIQYPYIADAVQEELKLAGLMPALGPVKKWGMDLNAYKQSLADNMQRELDYRSEAERQSFMGQQLNIEGLIIPKIYSELCTRRVLVQSWEEGVLLDQVLHWSKLERMIIARTLLLTLFKSLFKLGEVHGDPHLGNAFYRQSDDQRAKVILLDYGCTIQITETARLALLQMIIKSREGDTREALINFAAMGFEAEKLAYIASELPLLAQILFKPFLFDEPFVAKEWHIKMYFEQLLADKKWWFRAAGPANLFLLMRAFQGIVKQLDRLQVDLPWWPILVQAVGEELLSSARLFSLPEVSVDISHVTGIAHTLKICVTQQEKKVVELSFPAQVALDLEDIMPTDIRVKILSETNFDFAQLKQTLLETRFAAREILNFEKQGKKYRIWLE